MMATAAVANTRNVSEDVGDDRAKIIGLDTKGLTIAQARR